MKKLQNKVKAIRLRLGELRSDLFFQSLADKEKNILYKSLKSLNEFEDMLIITKIMKK